MSVSIGVTIAVTMMLALVSTAQARPISEEAIQALQYKVNEHCLTGSLTGASKREIRTILRKSRPLCRKYTRQLERIHPRK